MNDIEDDVPKQKPWEPAVGIRILRSDNGSDRLQQMYYRRNVDGVTFDREWRDVPIVTDSD